MRSLNSRFQLCLYFYLSPFFCLWCVLQSLQYSSSNYLEAWKVLGHLGYSKMLWYLMSIPIEQSSLLAHCNTLLRTWSICTEDADLPTAFDLAWTWDVSNKIHAHIDLQSFQYLFCKTFWFSRYPSPEIVWWRAFLYPLHHTKISTYCRMK